MQRLFCFIAFFGSAFLFQSCSPARLYYQPLTQRPSKPWEGNSTSWGGYSESSIDKHRVKVTFETFNRPGPEFAGYFVNVRAAEIALSQGDNTFWLRSKGTKQWTGKSHFSGYVIPGYWDYCEREVIHCTRHCKKGCRSHIDIIRDRFWVPDRYVPPHTSVNLFSKAEIIISNKPSGTRVQAINIISDALSNRHGFGKPRLNPYTMNAYRTQMAKLNP